MKPIVAIVGRPNVGKSRIFNRLTESQRAIVFDFEGVTRDRQYADAEWYGKNYTLIDTGGYVPKTDDAILSLMRDQAQLAMEEADVIMFVMDAKSGLLPDDQKIADQLRDSDKPVYWVVNKVDSFQKRHETIADFYTLGLELFPISAEHGHGMDDLMDALAEDLPKVEEVVDPPFARIAVVGKPNAGKSSTINALLGTARLLTSNTPGTTRDSVDTMLEHDGKEYLIIDTAGLRRKSSISERLEEWSVVQAIRSIDRADIALFVIDATQGITAQDKKVAAVVNNRGRGCIIVVNKWDLIEDKDNNTVNEWVKDLRHMLPFLTFAPIVFTSALTKQRLHKLLPTVDRVFEQYIRRVKTSDVNQMLTLVMGRHSPPLYQNKPLKFFYASQVATRPPRFVFVVNNPMGIAPAYRRFLERQIREKYGFEGTPIKTIVRKRKKREDDKNAVYD